MNGNDEDPPIIDPYEEFFKLRPLWERLKKYNYPFSNKIKVPVQYEEGKSGD